jgi:hypothetical protein
MYKGADKYRNPLRHHMAPLYHFPGTLAKTETPIPHGSGGINIRGNMEPRGDRYNGHGEQSTSQEAITMLAETISKVMMVAGTTARKEASKMTEIPSAETPRGDPHAAHHHPLEELEAAEARDRQSFSNTP